MHNPRSVSQAGDSTLLQKEASEGQGLKGARAVFGYNRNSRETKGRPTKRSLCNQSTEEMGRNPLQSDFASAMRPKNSDVMHAEDY
ncbi:hypothetical protein TNCV_5139601 [Trichonephila clavipes]|nr:hypothetical protein TNCV_5139601 [Trichonephila clavipes]